MRDSDDGPSARSMNIPDMVRTYKLLSDGEGPRFSVRFAGAIAGVVVIVAALGALYYFGAPSTESHVPNEFAATSAENGDGTRTDYVGFLPGSFSPSIGFDPTQVDSAMRQWYIEHPDAIILSKEPRWVGSHLIGYEIRYRA